MDLGMQTALFEAKAALEEGEIPVGAVVMKDGVILGKGHNHREAKHDISSHAEIEAMKEAEARLGSWTLEGCTLYVTLEPCLMCSGAILQSRLSTLVYGVDDPQEGGISRYGVLPQKELLVYRGEGKEEAKELLHSFFDFLRKKESL